MDDQTPIVILVQPQMVENIGMCARAMMNCGLTRLRIVAPRDPWPLEEWLHERLMAASSGAHEPLEQAVLFDTLEDAVADLHHVYATTMRPRDMIKDVVTARHAAGDMHARVHEGQRVGVLFGPERTGLISDDIVRANTIITIPLNPVFASLNLAQAVLLVAYEWYQHADATPPHVRTNSGTVPATKQDVIYFMNRLEGMLDQAGFFPTEELRGPMVRNLRNTLQRAEMTDQEIRTWHGVLTALHAEK